MHSIKYLTKTLNLGEMRPQLRFSSSLKIGKESVAMYLKCKKCGQPNTKN